MSKLNLKPCPRCQHPHPTYCYNHFAFIMHHVVYCDECGYTARSMPSKKLAQWSWNHIKA